VGHPQDPELPARVPRRWAGAAPDDAPAPPPKPKRSYRPDPAWDKLLLIVGAAVVVAALLIVPGILNRGGQNPIAAAAEATSNSPGVRITFTAGFQGPVQMNMSGSGLLNGDTHRASIQVSTSGGVASGVPDFTIDEVVDDGDLYIKSPQLGQAFGASGTWMLIKSEAFGNLLQSAGGAGAGLSASPTSQLDALEDASDQVTEVGPEQIEGVETTHYAAVIDMGKLADALKEQVSGAFGDLIDKSLEQISNQTVDVWIDGQGLVRRETSSASMGGLGNFTMTMNLTDYGIRPNIEVPPSSEVFDATPFLERALDQLNG
jgi:hypothetical protein